MGFSVSWLAVPEAEKNNALKALGLAESNERQAVPESEFVGAVLATGWYLVWFDDASPAALKPESLRALSARTELLACQIEEHSMCSTAAHWVNGIERWFVAHDAEDGLTNLEVTGSPPAALESIRIKHLQLQEGASNVDHVFDIPLALAETLVGFRHDASYDDADGEIFTVLVPSGTASKKIASTLPQAVTPSPEMIAEARANPGGWVYQIAGNFGPNDHIAPESIKGAFKVDEDGNLTGEFQANPKYRGES